MDFGTYFKQITKIECMDLKNGKKIDKQRENKHFPGFIISKVK